jgi:methionyl-tRNA synthetase
MEKIVNKERKMAECKKFYLTTPIYYVNDVAHIGHAYTTIIADIIARYARLKGMDTYFLTGTDEHGQKIEESAKARGKNPQEYADEISLKFKNLWDEFEISYDKFIRTTDKVHKEGVKKAFKIMFEKGDIYKGEYEGNYCVSCETFFTETQLIDKEFCPDCGKPTRKLKEESYFFKLSKYEKQILDWYKEKTPILPKAKANEVIRFVEDGLRDLSITRTSFEWGVKLPEELNDPKHVVYVWLDALLNYVTALGYGSDDESLMERYWPADLHIVGKDILKFHAIYWPAFLMSLGLELPKNIAAHGWWTRDGEKMSKSKGNVINPKEVADAYGLENFRYFMVREVPFGADGDFSEKALIDRINNDLANDLGNLLNRIIGMSYKYFDGKIDSSKVREFYSKEMEEVENIIDNLEPLLYEMQLHKYLEELWKVFSIANKAIEVYQPWSMIKEGKTEETMALLGLIANILNRATFKLYAVMPKTMDKISNSLNYKIDTDGYDKFIRNKELLEEFTIQKTEPLFPKIEKPLLKQPEPKPEPKKEEKKVETKNDEGIITIDQFFNVSLKIGTIKVAEEVKKSKKLLRLEIDLGEGRNRQIVAGIKEFYSPESLVDTQVAVVANLKPAKLMGMLSEGMLLAAKDENGLHLLRPEAQKVEGTPIK